jgi:hypothetical protein
MTIFTWSLVIIFSLAKQANVAGENRRSERTLLPQENREQIPLAAPRSNIHQKHFEIQSEI